LDSLCVIGVPLLWPLIVIQSWSRKLSNDPLPFTAIDASPKGSLRLISGMRKAHETLFNVFSPIVCKRRARRSPSDEATRAERTVFADTVGQRDAPRDCA